MHYMALVKAAYDPADCYIRGPDNTPQRKRRQFQKMRQCAAKEFLEEEIAMKEYLTPEMKIVKLELSDIITDSTFKGETNVPDTVNSGSDLFWNPGQGGGSGNL